MELKIDGDDVNRLIADAILKSAMGEAVERIVKKTVDEVSKSYGNPLETTITAMIQKMVQEVLLTQHAEAIREKVCAALAGKLTDDFIDRIVESAASRYR